MKWKTKRKPQSGDTRWVRKFAFLPEEMETGNTVWLEYYWVLEKFFIPEWDCMHTMSYWSIKVKTESSPTQYWASVSKRESEKLTSPKA